MKNGLSKGFTLLEMSIVLVIIGVIIGGLLLGKSLLTTSRLQAVITDEDNYVTAVANFKQQYQALPGDMATAVSLWGSAGGGSGDNYTTSCSTVVNTSGTCNGNGDGKIAYTGNEYEAFTFWQHLYYAGMFAQRLNGVAASGGVYAATIGTNVPRSSIDAAGFAPVWKGTIAGGDVNYFAVTGSAFYGHVFIFGGPGSNSLTSSPVLTADQASGIDLKVDDGVPGTGKVRSFLNATSYAPNCATSATAYNLVATGANCSLIFLMGF